MYRLDLPALHDHHSHVSLYAALGGLPDISALCPEEAMACLAAQPRDRLSLVKGWRSDRLAFSDKAIAELPPLIAINFSLHGFVMTKAAIPHVEAAWPELARNYRDVQWTEGRLPELFEFYGVSAGFDGAKLEDFMQGLAGLGIGSVEDMACIGEKALAVTTASPWRDRVTSWASPSCYAKLSSGARQEVEGFKLFLDGSIGARSAAIEPAFLDGGQGRLLYDDTSLEELVSGLAAEGKALAVHAIGQRAIRQILDILERCSAHSLHFPKIRLEHVQFIGQEEAFRARNLGACLSMQPNFNSDSVDYADRLPELLLAANNPFRMLIDKAGFVPGRDLVFGSDGMPHGPEYALAWSLFPAYAGQRLSLEEFIAGYCPEKAKGAMGASLEIDEERRIVRQLRCSGV
jgi:hypothetical protein